MYSGGVKRVSGNILEAMGPVLDRQYPLLQQVGTLVWAVLARQLLLQAAERRGRLQGFFLVFPAAMIG
jgi:hypothetical protein